MSKHLWMQDLGIAAYCPKCSKPAFKRSSTHSYYERLIRRMTPRLPYRCHECGYRALVNPIRLRYPAVSHVQYEQHEDFSSSIDVPQIRLSSIFGNENENRKRVFAAQKSAELSRELRTAGRKGQDPVQHHDDSGTSSLKDKQIPSATPEFIPQFDDTNVNEPTSWDGEQQAARKYPSRCSQCGEFALYRSHCRTTLEALRKRMTSKRLYRCHNCDWRGWLRKRF